MEQKIKEIRESGNIKQIILANLFDIEPANLSKIEKGAHLPKKETINRILIALNIDINNLFSSKHIQTREDLINNINSILRNSTYEDL